MYDSINNIGINDKMEEIIQRSTEVSARLSSILKKS